MHTSNHPDLDQLNAYIRDPVALDYQHVRLHLATCAACRQQVSLLVDLHDHLPEVESDLYQQDVTDNTELQRVLQSHILEGFVDGHLSEPERRAAADILRENPQAVKAALHYVGHRAGMVAAPLDDQESITTERGQAQAHRDQSAVAEVWHHLRRWLGMRYPIGLTVPVSAIAAGLLSIAFISQLMPDTAGLHISHYQDNPVIEFQPAQDVPGIGFFAGANKTVQAFSGIETRLADDNVIRLSWPKVAGAVSYTMKLELIAQGRTVTVGKITSPSPQAEFKRAANDIGKRYVWRLTGRTGNGKGFSAKGGFVIDSMSN